MTSQQDQIVSKRTVYSEKIEGARGNYHLPARFDLTGGYLGISQFDNAAIKDRVLLSPRQLKALLAFVAKRTNIKPTQETSNGS
jgi:hypothetical protein